MKLDNYIVRSNKIAWQIVDGLAMIVIPSEPALCALNSTATRIWELIGEGQKVDYIVQKLCAEFDVPEQEARDEAIGFIEELLSKGAVEIK
ncbi:MAG: PqqD family protein [Candidatus Stahlbacteria bacterium]|nr:PqqD family protein [Candidatus Stahlbacteria bacterium]